MEYELINATDRDIPLLISYKLHSILDYAGDISREERTKITSYVSTQIGEMLSKYRLITTTDNIIGSLLIYRYQDGYLLDEIYLEDTYRNQGIGTDIIRKLQQVYYPIYLWVYQKNTKALRLYQKLNFTKYQTTDTRYLMKYIREEQ